MEASKNFIRYQSNVDVRYIKCDTVSDQTFDEALAKKDYIDLNTLLRTKYHVGDINALYFPPSGEVQEGTIFSVYKKTPSQKYYNYICTLNDEQYRVTDYNILSKDFYHYMVISETREASKYRTDEKALPKYFIYKNTDQYGNTNYFHTNFSQWSICNIEKQDDLSDEIYYKIGNTWLLGYNQEGESVVQNLGITSWDTLGRYPKVSKNNKNYDSMSFSSLLGSIQEYDKYIYEIGDTNDTLATVKSVIDYTEKTETYNTTTQEWEVQDPYARETEKLASWKEFIDSDYLKLLRDMKGNAWIIQIVDSAEYQISNTSALQTRISFQWKEVDSLSDSSIIAINETTV